MGEETHRFTNLNIHRTLQYSFSFCNSSGLKSLPYVDVWGVVEGDQIIIMPSKDVSDR